MDAPGLAAALEQLDTARGVVQQLDAQGLRRDHVAFNTWLRQQPEAAQNEVLAAIRTCRRFDDAVDELLARPERTGDPE